MRPLMQYFYLLAFAIFFTPYQANASSSAVYPGMPGGTSLLMCTNVNCTDSQTEQMASWQAWLKGAGTYYFILGNIATQRTWAIEVDIYRVNIGSKTEPQYKMVTDLTEYPLPSPAVYDYQEQWQSQLSFFRSGKGTSITIEKGTRDGEFDTWQPDLGFEGDLSSYLRGLPEAQSIYQARMIFTVTFPDGSTAQYLYQGPLMDTGLAFEYIVGSHKDKNGHPIPDNPVPTKPTTGVGGGGMASDGVIGGPSGNLLNYLTPISVDTAGTVVVGPVVPVDASGGDTGVGGGSYGFLYPNVVDN